jgi:phosphohistidine phosphatase
MELYLARHAESNSLEEDPERGLSDLGFRNIRKVAGFLKNLDICVDGICHSGKLRAKQTAHELAKTISATSGAKEREGIAPMDSIDPLKDELNKRNNNLMIVGHLPYLSNLASALLFGDESKSIINFQPGSIVKLSRSGQNKNSWRAEWMVHPAICPSNKLD